MARNEIVRLVGMGALGLALASCGSEVGKRVNACVDSSKTRDEYEVCRAEALRQYGYDAGLGR